MKSLPVVDLRSDTLTRPTAGMRAAMAEAPVGDDVFGEDPSVNALEARVAALLGKAAALFVPSGTMANQLAIRVQTEPGDELLCEAEAHPVIYEAGGPALLSGVSVRTVVGQRGQLDPEAVRRAFRPDNVHFSPLRLVAAEDTANRGGGSVHPLERLDGIAAAAHNGGARAHLDGARLMNAVVQSGVSAARRAAGFDTVSLCLSKGLGAPVGSLLAGTAPAIHKARRFRKAFGGGMRQAGILAAAGLYALDHHVDRLADDHRRARALSEALRAAGFEATDPETNMVYATVFSSDDALSTLAEAGVLALAVSPTVPRFVLHLDVDDDGLQRACAAVRRLRRP